MKYIYFASANPQFQVYTVGVFDRYEQAKNKLTKDLEERKFIYKDNFKIITEIEDFENSEIYYATCKKTSETSEKYYSFRIIAVEENETTNFEW